jgi:aerobic carbon-monoxide dehydrogenase medium subunit
VKPPPFEYHSPKSLADAAALLARLPNAKLLAGGQSLMPMLNMRFVAPDHVIDLNGVDGLSHIMEKPGGVVIGAMTRQCDMESSPIIAARLPVMQEAVRFIGHLQTRNRGTLGGSLCHLDPAAELPAVAMAYDAEISVYSARGVRTLPMASFPAFYMTPALEADEILTEVRFTPWPEGHGFAFDEFSRRRGDFAVVAVVVLLAVTARSVITRASITIGGIGSAPRRICEAEERLVGREATISVFEDTARMCGLVEAFEDPYASKAYRQHLVRTLVFRTLSVALARGGRHDNV